MKTTVFTRILIPVLLLLTVLVPLSALVFYGTAREAAFGRAKTNFEALQEELDALITAHFPNAETVPDQQRVTRFLREVSRITKKAKGDAEVLIYAAENRLVYPNDEPEDSSVLKLSDAVLNALGEGIDLKKEQVLNVDGEDVLVNVFAPIPESRAISLMVAYCPVESIVDGVKNTVILFTALIAVLSAILVIALILVARSVSKPLKTLEDASRAVAKKEPFPSGKEFTLKEAESLRLSMQDMSDRLNDADRAQKLFYQTVSHELRTPLMSIGGYAQGIEEGILPDTKGAAHVILAESERLNGLVDELLTLSRLDQAEAVQLNPLPLLPLLNDALDRVSGVAAAKGVSFTMSGDTNTAILGEEDLFDKILDNLLGNGVRHAKTAVQVSVLESENSVTVSVQDDGDGISPEDLPHLFERGYKGKNGHFGLGLSIAERASTALGALIIAENAPDGGAVFSVRFQKAQ